MKKITNRLISWASILEQSTEDQARATATMPGPTEPVPARREAV